MNLHVHVYIDCVYVLFNLQRSKLYYEMTMYYTELVFLQMAEYFCLC